MKILFIHQNFPGQFKHLAPALAHLGHEVRALSISNHAVAGVEIHKYSVKQGSSPNIFPLARDFETKLIRAEGCAQGLMQLRAKGFSPDLVIAHPGWGETMFVKDVFPKAKQLHFIEFYYANLGADVGFDPEFESIYDDAPFRVTVKNAHVHLALNEMDRAYAPTLWQKSRVPSLHQPQIEVIFDGIDTTAVRPADDCKSLELQFKNDQGQVKTLRQGDPVITFVNRNLEPYRGYHIFMRSLPEILKRCPRAQVLIVGGEGTSYGAKPPKGKTWKQIYLDEVKDQLDLSRIFFLGNLPYEAYLKVLKLSACHVYLTYPFVLSWSCLEAMSTGCVVVGSKTAPVMEVIEDGVNGLLVDFFDVNGWVQTISQVLNNPQDYAQLRKRARETVVKNYDLNQVCLPAQIRLVEDLMQ